MLKILECLSPQQLHDLQFLLDACQQEDGGTPPVYPHILKERRHLPSTVLYYQQGELLAFASAFFFYQDSCEISLLVHPGQRRKGLARRLLKSLMPLFRTQRIRRLIFSTMQSSQNQWLSAMGFTCERIPYGPQGQRQGIAILSFAL